MSNNDDLDKISKSAESDVKAQANTEAKEDVPPKAKTKEVKSAGSFFQRIKK